MRSLAAAMEHDRDKGSMSAEHHLAVEKAVQATGIPTTILRPGNFANNLLLWAHSIQAAGAVFAPYAKSAQAPIHEVDIAAVATLALTQRGHEGKTYAMTEPQTLTRMEQLDAISDAIDRKLRFQEISPEAFQQEMSKYMPPPVIKMLLDYLVRHGDEARGRRADRAGAHRSICKRPVDRVLPQVRAPRQDAGRDARDEAISQRASARFAQRRGPAAFASRPCSPLALA
jgi:uncharacterized protein YbjT (DUF2867 family)